MKWLIIDDDTRIYDNKYRYINIGDCVQGFAIETLLLQMGVSQSDIIYTTKQKIKNYEGEPAVYPVNFFMYDGEDIVYPDNVKPVFLGLSLARRHAGLTQPQIAYLKKHAPIGCRDITTYEFISSFGIPAYFYGCVTMTLPTRVDCVGDTVFIVDAPKALLPHIPADLLARAEYVHQEFTEDYAYFTNGAYQYTKDIFNKYNEKAELVITSRLHCAIPCMAAGIPVILARDYVSYTFDFLHNIMPVYYPETFDTIDWNPQPVVNNAHKEMMKMIAISRLKSCYENNFDVVSPKYSISTARASIKTFEQQMEQRFCNNDKVQYMVWGMNGLAEEVCAHINAHYPNFEMIGAVDTYAHNRHMLKLEKKLNGIDITDVSTIKNNPNALVIVTFNLTTTALQYLEKINRKEKDFLLIAEPYLSNAEVIK